MESPYILRNNKRALALRAVQGQNSMRLGDRPFRRYTHLLIAPESQRNCEMSGDPSGKAEVQNREYR
jgi:hypothetical protein